MKALDIIFTVGASLSGVLALVYSAWAAVMRGRGLSASAPALLAGGSLLVALLYATLALDARTYLRVDGVEVPYLRAATNAVVGTAAAWVVARALWMDEGDCGVVVVGAALGLSALLGADISRYPLSWWWWAVGTATLLLLHLFVVRRMRRADTVALLHVAGAGVLTVGLALTQALSWAMGEVLDHSPHRRNSEIAYLCVAGVALLIAAPLMLLAWRERPSEIRRAVANAQVASPIMRHPKMH